MYYLYFQGLFKVYPLPSDPNEEVPVRILSNMPTSEPEEYVVRVYCVQAMDLQPNDPTGLVGTPQPRYNMRVRVLLIDCVT